jgi:hypothetical protein
MVPPTLSADEAAKPIGLAGERCHSFANAEAGRRNVVFRRYDGHQGLTTPT